jgi:23S rRNA (uracil1939-C5)-methyltransferase
MTQAHDHSQGEEVVLILADMANGGKAVGRDDHNRAIFVPLAIPAERVRVEVIDPKPRYAHAKLVEILEPSADRVPPRCPYFGNCGGCHFQHIDYQAQLRYKQSVVKDQLRRIGRLSDVSVIPPLANPEPWSYSNDVTFDSVNDGELGFWSPTRDEVIRIEVCHIVRKELLELIGHVDLSLPTLRRLTLRQGDDGEVMAMLVIDGNDSPSLKTDIPISVNQLLADGTTVNLVGDNHIFRVVKGRQFRVTAGCYFYPDSGSAEQVVDAVLRYAALSNNDQVLELYSGVGLLTAHLSQAARQVIGIEANPEAVADLSSNLNDCDNVTIYQGDFTEIRPQIDAPAQVLVMSPPASGLATSLLDEIGRIEPDELVYISSDIATMARDGRRLSENGYHLEEVQPIDMWPHTYFILTVSSWTRRT